MRRAEKMLLHTDFSIEKIVETVGYTDKSRFYRNFKAMYCVSPVKYRKGRGELCPYPSNLEENIETRRTWSEKNTGIYTRKNPAAYDSPIRSWKEFRERFFN